MLIGVLALRCTSVEIPTFVPANIPQTASVVSLLLLSGVMRPLLLLAADSPFLIRPLVVGLVGLVPVLLVSASTSEHSPKLGRGPVPVLPAVEADTSVRTLLLLVEPVPVLLLMWARTWAHLPTFLVLLVSLVVGLLILSR